MSQNLIQVWFTSARQQLAGVSDACLFVINSEKKSLVLVETTNKEFGQSKHLVENIQAVVQRRKSIVTINRHVKENTAVANSAVMNHAVSQTKHSSKSGSVTKRH